MWMSKEGQSIQVRRVHGLSVLELTLRSNNVPEPKTPIIPTQEISIHRFKSILILGHPQNGFINAIVAFSFPTFTTRIIQPSSGYSSAVTCCGDKNGKRRTHRCTSRQTRTLRNPERRFTVERTFTERRPRTTHHEPRYDIPILCSNPTPQNQHIRQFGSYPEYYVSARESVPVYGVSE
jgi:hypothetical protein